MRSQPGCSPGPFLESLFINVYRCCLLLSATIWKVCESAVERILENRLHTSISWGEIKVISAWKHQWTIKFPRPLSTLNCTGWLPRGGTTMDAICCCTQECFLQTLRDPVCIPAGIHVDVESIFIPRIRCVCSCFANKTSLTTVEPAPSSTG